jgi:hypothetical protein
LIVLRRKMRGRPRLTNNDRWFLFNCIGGFRRSCCYLRWKSRPLGGRSQIETELRGFDPADERRKSAWGAPRIHGELLKLGIEVAQSSVGKYMIKRQGPPSQGWRTFLRNHAPNIAAMDLFVVPTIGFDLLYALVIVRLDRRDLVWINVTTNPTAEWIARQITEAFPWDDAPKYLIPVSFVHGPSLADFITIIVGFKFSVHTGIAQANCTSARMQPTLLLTVRLSASE